MTVDFSINKTNNPFFLSRRTIFKKLTPKTCLTVATSPSMLLLATWTRHSVCFPPIVFFLIYFISIFIKVQHYCAYIYIYICMYVCMYKHAHTLESAHELCTCNNTKFFANCWYSEWLLVNEKNNVNNKPRWEIIRSLPHYQFVKML